jgi:hypothetical protein
MEMPFTQISPSLVQGPFSAPSNNSQSTQTAPNRALEFLEKVSLSKLAKMLESSPQPTLQTALESSLVRANRHAPCCLIPQSLLELKTRTDSAITLLIHCLVVSFQKIQKKLSNLNKFFLFELQAPSLCCHFSPGAAHEGDQEYRPSLPLSGPVLLADLPLEIVTILSSQSIDINSNWQHIQPSGHYFLLLNYFVYQVLSLQLLNNLLTINQEAFQVGIPSFPDLIYLPFAIGLILVHKLLPTPLSELVIEFLVTCFGQTRRRCSEMAAFDDKFQIEISGHFGYRLLNSPFRSDLEQFFMVFRSVVEATLAKLRDGPLSAWVFACFLDEIDFPTKISSLSCMIVRK